MDVGMIKNGFPRQSSARVKVRRLKWSVPFDSVSDYPFIITNLCQNNRDDKRKTTLKRQCPLRPSEIENMWHMMKNQNSPFLAQRYLMVALETWWHFLLRNYF